MLIGILCYAFSPASTVAPTEGEFGCRKSSKCFTDGTWALSNPLGCAVAITALSVLVEEDLANRALILGEKFRTAIRDLKSPLVKLVRGRGLLNAVIIDESQSVRGRSAWQFCLLLKSRGVLAKPTHVNMYVQSPVILPRTLLIKQQHSLCSSARYL